MVWQKKKHLSEPCITALQAERSSARQAKYLSGGSEGKKVFFNLYLFIFLLSEMSNFKRHCINYLPDFLQTDILIMAGGAYTLSVWLHCTGGMMGVANMLWTVKNNNLSCQI